jgi:hypothetical protein
MSQTATAQEDVELQFDPELWAEVLKHPGKWVVLDDALHGRIVAIRDDPRDASTEAARQGVGTPVLIEVPADTTTLLL